MRHEIRTDITGYYADQNKRAYQPEVWPGTAGGWVKTVPWGFRKLLNWIKRTYGNPPVYITENGFNDGQLDGTQDAGRVDYYVRYINAMLKAVRLDGWNVKVYAAWSLMDNVEWVPAYS